MVSLHKMKRSVILLLIILSTSLNINASVCDHNCSDSLKENLRNSTKEFQNGNLEKGVEIFTEAMPDQYDCFYPHHKTYLKLVRFFYKKHKRGLMSKELMSAAKIILNSGFQYMDKDAKFRSMYNKIME